jgi:hypothetical protein
MKILRWFLVVLIILAGWNILAALAFGDVYHGTVVDEETGDPVEGASVTVISGIGLQLYSWRVPYTSRTRRKP